MDQTRITRRRAMAAPVIALCVPPAASAIGSDDRALLALCADLRRLCEQFSVLNIEADRLEGSAYLLVDASINRVLDAKSRVMDRLAGLPAKTPAGLAAKARAVVNFHGGPNDYGSGYAHQRLEWSVFVQLAGANDAA